MIFKNNSKIYQHVYISFQIFRSNKLHETLTITLILHNVKHNLYNVRNIFSGVGYYFC
jgi:hypothetical protein